MSVYCIADTHLSLGCDKPMDVFGPIWAAHTERLRENWPAQGPRDLVVIAGDISWGKNLPEAQPDLEFIAALPGQKLLLPGNHDPWWHSTNKLNAQYNGRGLFFLKNNYFVWEDHAICGGRGWLCPNDVHFTPHDEKIYLREIGRIRQSLSLAVQDGYTPALLAMHYPPTNDQKEPSGFTELIRSFGVKQVVYGHLHGADSAFASYQGDVDGVNYRLVAADYIRFKPILCL